MENLEIQGQSTLESELETNIEETKSELKNLNESIQKESDKKSVEKIGLNKVKFPYRSSDHECNLILEKKGNNVLVKLESIPTYMGFPMENEFKKPEKNIWKTGQEIQASSSTVFLKELGKALDEIIGTGRVSAADKASQAYELLGFK